MQSLVPSLPPKNLILLTTFFSVVFLNLGKAKPLRIDKDRTPPRLVKTGPLRIGKNKTLPDWHNWDPSGLTKKTPPDSLPFRLEQRKIALFNRYYPLVGVKGLSKFFFIKREGSTFPNW